MRVIESNPAIAEIMMLVLTTAGHRAFQHTSGRQALRAHAGIGPDVILLAGSLPDVAAEDMCRELRARTAVPIIVLSTDHDPDLAEALRAEGASDCLRLPVHTRELLDRISTLLQEDRQAIAPPGSATTKPAPSAAA
ncbi:hypothetical protein NS14008_20680 [Nocardia seriolae]|nr:hypothetical protein NS14008_20680 [Nocardia seriolae]